MHAKYKKYSNLYTILKLIDVSYNFKSFTKAINITIEGVIKFIGNREDTKMWEEPWICINNKPTCLKILLKFL